MNIIKKGLLPLILLLVFPMSAFASGGKIVKEENGKKCIDLSVAYEDLKNTSQAITGQEQSLDSVKKAQTLATLSNIYSFFMGDSAYCVKDEVAASDASSFKTKGVLGMVEDGNKNLLSVFPSFNVIDHLAQEFVPGYGGNNSSLAQEKDPAKDSSQKNKELSVELEKNDETGAEIGEMDEDIKEIQEAEENSPDLDSLGYSYLKDSMKLDKLWAQSRNIAYIFFVLAMIVIGFMIMFRSKLGGQVIVSISNSIPQLIICLILVTFSFAIAGIMLDIGRASMQVVERVFITAQEAAGDTTPTVMNIKGFGRLNDQLMFSFNPFDMIREKVKDIRFVGKGLAKALDFVVEPWEQRGGVGSGLLWTGIAGMLFKTSNILGTIKNQEMLDIDIGGEAGIVVASGSVTGEISGPIEAAADVMLSKGQTAILGFFFLILLFIVVCAYASIKLFITILTTYIKIFVNVVLGPLQIASGAVPGNFSAVGNWFKSLASNILVFPVIIAILNIFNYLGANIDPGKFNFFGNKGVFWPGALLSIRGIFMFAGYLFAANAPALVNGFLKVGENKTMSAVGDTVKRTASKIPMIGGMFGK